MLKISLDLKKSLEENAADYFDEAKKAKKKLQGALKAVEEFKLKKIKADKENIKLEEASKLKEKEKNRKKFWFEKYKWFISSDNFLVIAGKDATTNEEVVKKHTESNDLVFHTDAPGSAFVVIKKNGAEVPDTTLSEAAVFTGLHSKAWSSGMRSADVFMVNPDQVTKEAKSGEFVGKGSFMIYGKRTNFNVNLDLGVGIKEYEGQKLVMVAPESTIKKLDNYVLLKQGSLKKGEISKKLMKTLNLQTNEALLSLLPSGRFDFVKVK
ncbi:MAG: NFACT RNA binding domain-containing protein [Candidatus Woesearchaeota archaeon]